jgi:hypothetical protein
MPNWRWRDGRGGGGCSVSSPARDDDYLVSFVAGQNANRRHDNESQRALAAARIATLSQGRLGSNAQICAFDLTQDEAADLLQVSRRLVQTARALLERGTPEQVAAVERGTMSVSAAVKQLPPTCSVRNSNIRRMKNGFATERVDAVATGDVVSAHDPARHRRTNLQADAQVRATTRAGCPRMG